MIIFKSILAFIRLIIFAVTLIVSFSVYLLIAKLFFRHTTNSGFAFRKYYLTFLNFVMGINEQIEGKPDSSPALYVCNHRGMTDFFVNLKHLNAFILSKAEVEDIPVLGFIANYTGIFYLERKSKDSREAARKAIVEILQSGNNVILYPEGTTNTGKTTMSFRLGAFEEAAKNGFRVVPVALEYKDKFDLWKSTSMTRQFINQFGKLFTHVKMSFGTPIENNDPVILMNKSKDWIDKKLLEMQDNWSEAY
ncbi:MAG: lysophospholipid acyltransferase family protein [Deltaproteobacteria bacterium]